MHQLRYELLRALQVTDRNSEALGKLNLSSSQNVSNYFYLSLIPLSRRMLPRPTVQLYFEIFMDEIISTFRFPNGTELVLPEGTWRHVLVYFEL